MTIHLDGRSLTDVGTPTIEQRAAIVARIAREHAEATDKASEFPQAAVDALRQNKLLSIAVPAQFGGEQASLRDLANVSYVLGQSCAATGMIFAMHQAALACVIQHGADQTWHCELLRRVCQEQLLFASSTTEGNNGGNVRSSDAALVEDGAFVRLARAATVMSYGAHADVIVSTARRAAEAAASDQVAIVLLRQDIEATATGSWDVFGMRGTCSGGFDIKACAHRDQVLPAPYSVVHASAMVPVSHVAWASVWAGIAAAALSKAQLFARMVLRRTGAPPPGAALATRAAATHLTLRNLIRSTAHDISASAGESGSPTLEQQTQLSMLKVQASELATSTVLDSMRACGLAGFRNDGPYGVGRHVRDILSAPVMIHNERILANIATATLMSGVPETLFAERSGAAA